MTPQTDAQLAAILTTETIDRFWGEITGPFAMNFSRVEGRSIIKVLIRSHRTLTERLAEAERSDDLLEQQVEDLQKQYVIQAAELATAQATIEKQRSRIGDLWGTLHEHQWGCRCEGNELCPACGFSIRTREGRHAKSCDIARALATQGE